MSSGRAFRIALSAALAAALSTAPASAQQAEPETPIADLRREAESGNRDSQRSLGIRLLMQNTEQSLVEARQWLRRAMEAGDAEAKNGYAGMLINGAGGPADEIEGRRLLLEAASEGSSGANMTLSMAYRDGSGGFPQDSARAFTHMERAVGLATGIALARLQWELGMMHLRGVGTPANAVEAYRWVSRSAEGGQIRGMISRAVMLATAEGVAEDDVAARQWYERASQLDDPFLAHALRGLGSMLVTGEGGPADVPRGIAYLRIAEGGGDGNARIILQQFASRVTPEVDREATRIAAAWLAARPRANLRPRP